MPPHRHRHRQSELTPSFSFALLVILFLALCLAGGASRADALGQAVVRGTATLILAMLAVFGRRPRVGLAAPILAFLSASAVLVLLQLVPLPLGLWQALPGRTLFLRGIQIEGAWRPLAIAPDAAVNAAGSLLIPFSVLLLALGLRPLERERLSTAALSLIFLSMLVGLAQFSGSNVSNIFINSTSGDVAGTFANSNHFALFMAIGCVVAPTWAVLGGRQWRWRCPVAVGLVTLFELMILASGSRTGMALGLLAIAGGLLIAERSMRSAMRSYPRWVFVSVLLIVAAVVGSIVIILVSSDRLTSVSRALSVDVQTDMRVRAAPTVISMAWSYFPVGSGFGGFDTVFRIHEPFGLLQQTYFNHAHNDFIEIILDGGLPALLLLLVSIVWWLSVSIRVWRDALSAEVTLGRLGSVILMLILVASLFDYPARTPMIMAMIVLAALWLGWAARRQNSAS